MAYKTPTKYAGMTEGSPDFSKMRSLSPMKGAAPTTKVTAAFVSNILNSLYIGAL